MKSYFKIALAALLVFTCFAVDALAVTYTVTSREEYTDVLGNQKKRVIGTIAFDSDYPCNTTTGRCGEYLVPNQIGMTSIDILSVHANETVGNASNEGIFSWAYHPNGTAGNGSAGALRAYYDDGTGIGNAVSAPTYDLAALDAVPFMAIGR